MLIGYGLLDSQTLIGALISCRWENNEESKSRRESRKGYRQFIKPDVTFAPFAIKGAASDSLGYVFFGGEEEATYQRYELSPLVLV